MSTRREVCWDISSLGIRMTGKTSQVISRILFMLGENPDRRIKIVCNLDEFATKRVNAVREYMEKSVEYKRVFPNVYPDVKDKWGERRINVKRTIYGSADYSLEGGGIFSSAVSGRADVIIADDITDYKNSVLNAASRKNVIDSLTNNWMSRLEPGGFCIYIATPWHINDCTFFLINQNTRFKWIIMKVADDLSQLEVTRRWFE